MQTVAEVPEFIRRSRRILSDKERESLVEFLALRPKAGALIQGTGGLRKLRWARQGGGKSGGARVIYYFFDESIPLYLLTIFAKGERSDLSQKEKKLLASLAESIVKTWKVRRHE